MFSIMRLSSTVLMLFVVSSFAAAGHIALLGKKLEQRYRALRPDEREVVIIYFADKGDRAKVAGFDARQLVSERSLKRRLKTRPADSLVDEADYPLEQVYVSAVEQNVVMVRHQLKWFNAVSVVATRQQIDAIRGMPFVREIDLVGRWKVDRSTELVNSSRNPFEAKQPQGAASLDYGPSFAQLNQINVPAVHNLGFYGQGVVIGIFDDGVRLQTHEAFDSMNIIAQHDFVDHKASVVPYDPNAGWHGTSTLSAIGGYKPGQLIGPAFKADFILARTENDSSETPIEEDNWAKGIEWADSIGVDVTSTSLGYLTYDSPYTSWTWQNMDGNTTLITRAADHAVGLGIVVVNAAGNDGYNASHNTLIAPADGDSVITAGAVDVSGVRASFSSVGPTFDGRIKPDIVAMGVSDYLASAGGNSSYGTGSGTSFACPLSAGVAALVVCANPHLTPMQVRDAMRQTASNAGSPNNLIGWGILNALAAVNYYGPHYFVLRGWNLLSLPLKVTDGRKSSVYSSSQSDAFIYNHGYQIADTILNNVGYWLKFASSDSIPINGEQRLLDTVHVRQGWNLIGTLSVPVEVANIVQTSDSILKPFFSYDAQYGTYNILTSLDTLFPHRGYWVKASAGGEFVLSAGGMRVHPALVSSTEKSLESMSTITVRDRDGKNRTLYFGSHERVPQNIALVELPPKPPQEAFDVRFSNGFTVWISAKESGDASVPIEIQGARFPLEVSWDVKGKEGSYALSYESAGDAHTAPRDIQMSSTGNVTITDSHVSILNLKENGSFTVLQATPKEFRLEQNYPNPFNPTTVIAYQLPVGSYVNLRVYNVLGQEVRALIDGIQEAGFVSVEWNATNNSGLSVPSGLYFYRLEAAGTDGHGKSFVQVRKMLIIK